VNFASRPFYQVADRVLGSQLLGDLADFFILFQTMRDGFVARAEAVNRLLRDVRTTFLLVTTLEAVPAREAQEMAQALADRRLHLGLLVCNKVLPAALSDPAVSKVADRLGSDAQNLAVPLATNLRGSEPPEVVAAVLGELAQSFSNFHLVANREAELLRELAAAHEVAATVGYQPGNITDLAGLLRIGGTIWGDTEEDEAQVPAPRARSRSRPNPAKGSRSGNTDAKNTNDTDKKES
jgi:anion-transporting  ArsA/GET3 family ATPase